MGQWCPARRQEGAEPAVPGAIHTVDRPAAASSLLLWDALDQSVVCEEAILLPCPHLLKN